MTDRPTPGESAMGTDIYDHFPGPRALAAELVRSHADRGHDFQCLMAKVKDEIPEGPVRAGVPYRLRADESL